MLCMMSRAVLTSSSVLNNLYKEIGLWRDLRAHLRRRTVCAEQSSNACANVSDAAAQKLQGMEAWSIDALQCRAARPSLKQW